MHGHVNPAADPPPSRTSYHGYRSVRGGNCLYKYLSEAYDAT